MKRALIALTLTMTLLFPLLATSAETAPAADKPAVAAPAPAVAPAPATTPTSAPASAPALLATVAGKEITTTNVNAILDKVADGVPPEQRGEAVKQILERLVFLEMTRHYMDAQKITCTDEDLAAKKKEIEKIATKAGMTTEQFLKANGVTDDMIRDKVRLDKMLDQATTKDKVEAYIKANPDQFNGTTVKASHILIACPQFAPQAEQTAAREKLEKIAADIKAGKIKFEDAAKQFSSCPSKEQGGDLGEFTFEKMVLPFSVAAFATKTGELTPVVRTKFGYHLIKVTDRKPGTEKVDETAQDKARQLLSAILQEDVMNQKDCPVVIK